MDAPMPIPKAIPAPRNTMYDFMIGNLRVPEGGPQRKGKKLHAKPGFYGENSWEMIGNALNSAVLWKPGKMPAFSWLYGETCGKIVPKRSWCDLWGP